MSQLEFLDQPAFKGKRRLYNVVLVEFRTSFLKREADARELNLAAGDDVVVDTNRGPAIARVCTPVHRKVMPPDQVLRVMRRANDADLAQLEANQQLERQAYAFAIARIRERDLAMKLVRVQVMHDGSRVVFYFSSESRVDFRDLVKDLAHRLRTRIEMHQIGARDGTRMIGGIGPCGRELCCSTFLTDFAPVSIRMAKDQGLTLNPAKVSGMCGRLMCCLVYEQAVYKRMRKGLPRAGRMVDTPEGLAKVIEVDVINERLTVVLEDSNRRVFAAADVQYHDPNAPQDNADETDSDTDYIWDDLKPEAPKSDEDPSKRARRKKKRRPDAGAKPLDAGTGPQRDQTGVTRSGGKPDPRQRQEPRGDKPAPAKSNEANAAPPQATGSAAPPAGDEGEKKRRRRRSRRRKPAEGGSKDDT